MKYQAIFFDFDGVILDSVHVKTRTFGAMFSQYGPDIEKAVVEYHLANGGVSRFKKFEYYYNNLLNKPITQEELNALGEKFSSMTLQGVMDSPYIPGALEALKHLKDNNIPCFVASGTPDEEIKLIVKKKDLSRYFIEVHGSPRTKDHIITHIAQRYGFDFGQCLFIGDAMTDYKVARATGTKFLGIVLEGYSSPFPDDTWIEDAVKLKKAESHEQI
jgi:HAD superfamily hydrolase (TIGR01549 family)